MKKYFFILMAFMPLALSAQVAVTATGSDQPKKFGLSELISSNYSDQDRFSFFEVSEDMFKAFCEMENADSTSIALFKKIKSVKMLEVQYTPEEMKKMEKKNPESQTVDPWFYNEIIDQLDISEYNQLLKSRNNRSMALFLKKEYGPADNEFLLITDRLVIDIRGDIMIKTIYQMEEMMGYVQQILPN
ncbi:MAG: hypothetical protein NTV01_10455 [Bacteroidia bacterium]|nr:hypothetical protein [Bacteroidia bacterium]